MAINGRSRNWKKVFHEQLEEDAVEDTWRRCHRPLMNTALDDFGVKSVRNNFRPRRIPQLSGTSRMILMCMGEKNIFDLFGSQPFICNGLEYRVPVLRKSGIDDGIAECAMQEKAIANAQFERLDRARYELEMHWIFLITLNLGLARICSAVSITRLRGVRLDLEDALLVPNGLL